MAEERIYSVPIEEEMQSSYLDYAMSVIVGRALPDVRDGLKPVHRRILFAMYSLGLFHNKPYKKSATVVGEVLGKFHPHGDAAVYDTLVRMAQDFTMRYPLVDGQGNFGSVDGDSAAAYRYTEARLSRISEELLSDIDKDTVDFVPNFDERLKEPVVLPAGFPNLLVNGSSGIAVGMATNIPPHNLSETIDALLEMIDNPDVDLDGVMKYIKGPDFPTSGEILGAQAIKEGYANGSGSIVVQAKFHIEEGKRGKDSIIVTELPYQVNKANLITDIANLVKTGRIDGISDIRDESNRDGIRIVLEMKQNAQVNVIINKLLVHTKLRTTFGMNFLALIDGVPKRMSLVTMLRHYLEHRKVVVERRTKFLLDKAEKRAHIIEGLKRALDHIDEIIAIIKHSKDVPQAKKALMQRFKFSDVQAQAILDMKLARLTALQRSELENEYLSIIKEIERLKSILSSPEALNSVIKKELKNIKNTYGDKRRTKIIAKGPEKFEDRDLIKEEEVVVTVTHKGWIKRLPLSVYRSQGRGGRGVMGMAQGENDFVEKIYVASTHDNMLIFTEKGKCYGIDVFEIPEGSRVSKGRSILNLINISRKEKLRGIVCEKNIDQVKITMVTKKGIIKKVSGSAFKHARKNGIIAMNVKEDDELIDVSVLYGEEDVILISHCGVAVRFSAERVRTMGRTAAGVRGIRLRKDDYVVSVIIVRKESHLFIVTEKGYGKRTSISEFRKTGRGVKGVRAIKITEKNGYVIGAAPVNETDEIIFISQKGQILRAKAKDISVQHRSSTGVKVVKIVGNDKLTDTERINLEL